MLRRPPTGEGRRVVHQKKLWAVAALLLPWIPLVDALNGAGNQHHAQQSLDSDHIRPVATPLLPGDHPVLPRQDAARRAKPRHESSPLEGDRVVRNLAATALTHDLIQTPHASLRRKSTYSHAQLDNNNNLDDLVSSDASAISAVAPDQSVVAPSPRRLEDWEVEEFVLLATIDGDLHAHDRKTGKERWHISLGQPMVETQHHRTNKSTTDPDHNKLDQTIWAVEPTKDGQIYMWAPGEEKGLVNTGLTMKRLVEDLSPYENKALSLVYTGDKKTALLTLDAATGRAVKWFGPKEAVAEPYSCPRPQDTVAGLDVEECNTATITLGRTEYTVRISSTRGFRIATLKYSEWSPNVFDSDLLRQYSTTLDNLYITSQHDGRVYAFDYNRDIERPDHFIKHFPTPIAQAFDIIRPIRESPEGGDNNNSELVALPQPPPPPREGFHGEGRDKKIFLNQTAGNWYALSGKAYPLITDSPPALVSQVPWWEVDKTSLDFARLSKVLAGQHTLDSVWPKGRGADILSLPGPSDRNSDDRRSDSDHPTLAIDAPNPTTTIIDAVKKLPQDAVHSVVDLVTNPVSIIIVAITLIIYRNQWIRSVKATYRRSLREAKGALKRQGFDVDLDDDSADEATDELAPSAPSNNEDEPSTSREGSVVAAPAEPPVNVPNSETQVESVSSEAPKVIVDGVEQAPPEKKRKAHRGRRAGKNHRKKNKAQDGEQSNGDEAINSVEEAVNNAKKLGEQARGPEPNVQTLPYEAEEVSNPILRINDSLEVNEDQQLGTGSNGTVVFAGKWQDRPVAVKRMLRTFYDIASQETRLLREVDRHQNVIQYFAQLERGDFIYIALELCEASLADVMEKPLQFRQLANAGSKDTLAVLKQITKGLDHLHSLAIGMSNIHDFLFVDLYLLTLASSPSGSEAPKHPDHNGSKDGSSTHPGLRLWSV